MINYGNFKKFINSKKKDKINSDKFITMQHKIDDELCKLRIGIVESLNHRFDSLDLGMTELYAQK